MLITTPLEAVNGVLDGNAQDREGWTEFAIPGTDFRYQHIMIGLQDPISGPRVTILSAVPTKDDIEWDMRPGTETWEQGQKFGLHYHRTDQWRFQLCEGQHFYIGPEEYHYGDFYVQPAGTWYFDPMGATGMLMFQTDADRRGSIGQNRDTRDAKGDAFIEAFPPMIHDMSMIKLGTAHDDDSKAVSGPAISTSDRVPKAGLKGSLFDTDGWTELSDGSRVCAIFEGDPVFGPLILLTQNAPGAVEAPAGTYGSDMVRQIVKGTCSVGGRIMGPEDYRAVEAGVSETEVVHGPEGSTEVLYVGDRRGWRSSGSGKDDTRAEEIAELVERTAPKGPALADA